MNAKDIRFKKIYEVISIAFFIFSIIIGTYGASNNGIMVSLGGYTSILFLLIPRLYGSLFKINRVYLFDIEIISFVFLAFTIGVGLRFYEFVNYYDLFAHTLAGMLFTQIGVCAFLYLKNKKSSYMIAEVGLLTVFSFCFSMMVGAIWEIGEFLIALIFGTDPQKVTLTGVSDTMEDMIVCLIGSIIMCILINIGIKKNKKSSALYLINVFNSELINSRH